MDKPTPLTHPKTATQVAQDAFTGEGAPAPGMVGASQVPEGDAPLQGATGGAPQRTEHDAWGDIELAADAPWGAQTQRALLHFAISTERMPQPLIGAIALVKRHAAQVNADLGWLDAARAEAIVRAADEVIAGDWPDAFPLPVWQSGSGTQTHMNVNEVLARRATALMPADRAQREVHPNDHVNRGQSSNDVVPTALHLAVLATAHADLLPALAALVDALRERALRFGGVVKTGRTHLQDAVPLTLGQELSGWVAQLEQAGAGLRQGLEGLHPLAIGGTAVGTGVNAHPLFAERMVSALGLATGWPLRRADNPFAAQAAHDALVRVHADLKVLALALYKVADDLRWLASGPRGGLGEWRLPANEPGSSIMPGKVNPTQCEAMLMRVAQVLGNDVAVGFASTLGQFQMQGAKPLLAHNLLQSVRLLADGMRSFERHCVQGMQPDTERIESALAPDMQQATLLARHLGYERAAALMRLAQTRRTSLREAVLAEGAASPSQFDEWVRAEAAPDAQTRAP